MEVTPWRFESSHPHRARQRAAERSASGDLHSLAVGVNVELRTLTDARDELAGEGLIGPTRDVPSGYELSADGHAALERVTTTGEQRLYDLLECWRPESTRSSPD